MILGNGNHHGFGLMEFFTIMFDSVIEPVPEELRSASVNSFYFGHWTVELESLERFLLNYGFVAENCS